MVSFDEPMYDNLTHTGDAVTNPANYRLVAERRRGGRQHRQVHYGLNEASALAAADPTDYGDLNVPATNRWEAVLTIDANGALQRNPPLTDGNYTIEALTLPTVVTDEIQTITFTPAPPPTAFTFNFSIGTFTSTDIAFDPNDPNAPATVAAQMTTQLANNGYPGTTVTPLPGGPPFVFSVNFGGRSAGIDQPPIAITVTPGTPLGLDATASVVETVKGSTTPTR